ncbi:hypothetical protein GCM10010910_01510 [Microbacterium nanhaiense]|uniref:D-alanyl-D-alanine carboxypeptidase-like core domain-containing protein n=1 Tax=Microbacterium nanhaiense TaxID=1301026 RepID=A0ABQ2MW32_9MICO|nr:D-alanyl-D-alanine carboxypeptidase family protein [Microbacterium nanhaiense]GGO59173.1 hypothetical protein GCM10010910_01510 [Microbacterium nanhaiense]
MALDYTTVDGWPVAPRTAQAFLTRLKPAFERAFPGVTLHVYSGYRSYEGQVEIFTSRYRRGAYSPFGDYRQWDGSTWGRVSGEGTVAAPGTSNHQSGHALDIRDSGSDAGVTIAGNARANWIRANASKYGFNAIGYTFAEPWHIELAGDPWAVTNTGAGGTAASEEDDMFTDDDRKLLQQIRDQQGGASSRKTSLRQDVDEIGREVSAIRKLIGSTLARAKAGDTIGVRLDKIIAHLGGRKKLGPKD